MFQVRYLIPIFTLFHLFEKKPEPTSIPPFNLRLQGVKLTYRE